MEVSDFQNLLRELQKTQTDVDQKIKAHQEIIKKLEFERNIVETQRAENQALLDQTKEEFARREATLASREADVQKIVDARLEAVKAEEARVGELKRQVLVQHKELQDAVRDARLEKSRVLDQQKQIKAMVERTTQLWASFT